MKNIRTILSCLIITTGLLLSNKSWSQNKEVLDDITKHVTTLASEEFEGRLAGSRGDSLSTDYILKELKSYPGVELWRNDGCQRFTFAQKAFHSKRENSLLIYGDKTFNWGKEYFPTAFSASTTVSAPVIFAGYGIDAYGEKSRNDFANIDVKNKWALILRDTPRDEISFNKHCTDYAKVQEAVKRGAAGVLLVHGTRDRSQYLECLELWQAQCDIPVICVSREVANTIIEDSGKTIEQLENEWMDNVQKTVIVSKDKLTTSLEINRVLASTNNIIGIVEGSDPELKDEIIVICAHYDHYGVDVYRGKLGEKSFQRQVYNGANDNASGTAGVLAMAKRYGAMKDKLKRSIAFVLIGAEERGLVGSKYLAQNLDLFKPYGEAKLVMNFDMIGTFSESDNPVLFYGINTFDEGEDITKSSIKKSKLNIKVNGGMGITSDHIPFNQHGSLPVLGLYTSDNKRIHTPFDDIEYINFEGMSDIIELANDVVDKLVLKQQNITFNINEK